MAPTTRTTTATPTSKRTCLASLRVPSWPGQRPTTGTRRSTPSNPASRTHPRRLVCGTRRRAPATRRSTTRQTPPGTPGRPPSRSLAEQRYEPDQRGRQYQGRQEVAHLHVLQGEELQRDADDEDAAGARERCQRLAALRKDVLEESGAEGECSLDHEHGARGQSHAPAER